MCLRHRVIAYAFLKLDINNMKCDVDHIDRNRLNNCVNNLRLTTHQQNMFNNSKKGYYWCKQQNKFHARIHLNGKSKHIGYFQTEKKAHDAYLKAKLIYHVIS